jgi:ribonuclease D
VDIAQVRPKDIEHLGSFRGLNKGELKASGEFILNAIKKSADEVGHHTPPTFQRTESPSNEESQVLDLMKVYIGIFAEQHRIAPKHLSTVSQLIPLLRNKIDTDEDLVKNGVLSAEAAKLIGTELIEFLHGNRGLAIKNGKIEIIEINAKGTRKV